MCKIILIGYPLISPKVSDTQLIPGKNIRWDPANPTWDPRCVPGGIPPGIMEHPAWDPAWDPTWNPAN